MNIYKFWLVVVFNILTSIGTGIFCHFFTSSIIAGPLFIAMVVIPFLFSLALTGSEVEDTVLENPYEIFEESGED